MLFIEARTLSPVALAAYGRLGDDGGARADRAPLRRPEAAEPLPRRVACAGAFDAAGLVGLATAISIGPVAIASVTASQGGTLAEILGLVVLCERVSRVQAAGMAPSRVAVTLLATG